MVLMGLILFIFRPYVSILPQINKLQFATVEELESKFIVLYNLALRDITLVYIKKFSSGYFTQ